MSMPEEVARHIGSALGVVQYGGKHPDTKAWKGLRTGVFEVVSDFDSNTFRAACVVRFEKAIHTAKVDVDLIAQRLKATASDYEERYEAKEEKR